MRTTTLVRPGRAREPKYLYTQRISTIEDKLKRHRRKARIWRRAVKRLERQLVANSDVVFAYTASA